MEIGYISILNNNFGDALNKPILSALSPNIHFVHSNQIISENPRISAIGSIAFLWTGNTIVWGSGILDERNVCPQNLKNMDFRLLRGPKSRELLSKLGYKNIPEVYCDPGVLAPYFYRKTLSEEKKYDVGIFPHNTEDIRWHIANSKNYKDKIIYISFNDHIDRILFKISQCRRIVSSSLHGIIVSEAMGIPVSWYQLTRQNDTFKFYDYFKGTNRENIKENNFIGCHPSSVNLLDIDTLPKGRFDIKGLLDSYPFDIDLSLRKSIINFYENN